MFRRATERLAWRIALVAVLVAAGILPASAANYFTRTWQVEQGLPQNKVTAVVQTRDGYLWVGTYNGLARFDGVRFTVFDDNNTPELRSSRITSLFEAADGTLWIGTESGAVSQYRDGHFTAVPLHANWSDGKIYAITADDAGDVWLLNEAGELARARDGKVLSPPSGDVAKVVSLAREIGRDDLGWIAKARCPRSTGGQLTAPMSTNRLFAGNLRRTRWRVLGGQQRRASKNGRTANGAANQCPAPWKSNIVANLLETSSGALAGGTSGDGLWLVFPRFNKHIRRCTLTAATDCRRTG